MHFHVEVRVFVNGNFFLFQFSRVAFWFARCKSVCACVEFSRVVSRKFSGRNHNLCTNCVYFNLTHLSISPLLIPFSFSLNCRTYFPINNTWNASAFAMDSRRRCVCFFSFCRRRSVGRLVLYGWCLTLGEFKYQQQELSIDNNVHTYYVYTPPR